MTAPCGGLHGGDDSLWRGELTEHPTPEQAASEAPAPVEVRCALGTDCPYPRTCCMVCRRHNAALHTNCILR